MDIIESFSKKSNCLLRPPERLQLSHDFSKFESDNPNLSHRLEYNALSRDYRTYVVCDNSQVVACYRLTTGAVNCEEEDDDLRASAVIPIMILGQLIVDFSWRKKGIGRSLLKDALLRVLHIADIIGVKAILAHALTEQAVEFYLRWGFHSFDTNPRTLFLSVREVKSLVKP